MRKHLHRLVRVSVVAGLLGSQFAGRGISVDAQTAALVEVDCAQGESINRALDQHPRSQSLIVEIRGMCNENVVVVRDRVTLRGADPERDGIRAVLNATQIDAALWVRGAHQVSVENLKLSGGFTGLLATEASTPFLRVVNSRLEGNSMFGTALQESLLEAEDTIFSANRFNAGVFNSSRFGCLRCTFSNPAASGANVVGLTGARILIGDSTLSGGNVRGDNSFVTINDSTIDVPATAGPSVDFAQSQVALTRVQVAGALRFTQGSSARLMGVVQTSSPSANSVEDSAFVRIGDAPPSPGEPPSIASTLLGVRLINFSNASLLQNSQINGNLTCALGANAVCTNPANVSGVSNCSLCPK